MANATFLGIPPACEARVKGTTSYSIGDDTFYETVQCGTPGKKKISVDGGDAQMTVCDACLRVFLDRKRWLGFYDCSLPQNTKDTIGSPYYYEKLLEIYKEDHPKVPNVPKVQYVAPGILRKWIEDLLKEGEKEERKEELLKELEEINKEIPESRPEFSKFLSLVKKKIEIEKELKSL
jgi:hypothetical protein